MRSNDRIHWRKTVIMRYLIAYMIVVGFVIFLAGAFLLPMRSGILSQLFIMAFYPVYLLIAFLALQSNRYIPRKYGISGEELRFQYRKKLESYRWTKISRIYSQRTRGSEKLAIESIDGDVTLIPFLLKNERERIIDHYENQREPNKPQ